MKGTLRFCQRPIALVVLAAAASAAHSQSLESFTFLGASTVPDSIQSFDSQFSNTGAFVSASGSENFHGLDRNGDQQSSTFGGHSTAQVYYGQLKTKAEATLTNSFFNPANADEGSPNYFVAVGQAKFKDTIKFSGSALVPTWKVRYTYFLDGAILGNDAYTSLLMEVGAEYDNIILDQPDPLIAQYWTTKTFELGIHLEHDIEATMLSSVFINTENWEDGSTISGASLFDSTAIMTKVQMFDENGIEQFDWSMTSLSGTNYQAVPEPATIMVGLMGMLVAARRRRKA